MSIKNRWIKFTAKLLIITMSMQLIMPVISNALTTGPSQPEVMSFEPVGTTDMVDLFTGDFTYNIPLLDVDGYPINISYHSGSDIEQEASWVGLGWNINPGVINRNMRGIPDDFNGDNVVKKLNIKDEENLRIGLSIGAELLGFGEGKINLSVAASLGGNINFSNYRGISVDFSVGANINVGPIASAGVNIGVGSQNGADIDYNSFKGLSLNGILNTDIGISTGFSNSGGYNTRSGVKDKIKGFSVSMNNGRSSTTLAQKSSTVPIALKNYVAVITNKSTLTSFRGQIKPGAEAYFAFPNISVMGMGSRLKYDSEGSRKGYGYLYSENATDEDMHDFTREKDGMFNKTMIFHSLGNMTYDVYGVSGQGTGGSFRPYRNDFGSVFDPLVENKGKERSMEFEAGLGNLFEMGTNISVSTSKTKSGPWDDYKRPFNKNKVGKSYENVYFKTAGELTKVDTSFKRMIGGYEPIDGVNVNDIPLNKAEDMREPRANLFYFYTNAEADKPGVATLKTIPNYTSTNGFATGYNTPVSAISRITGNRKAHHIGEVTQVQTDGTRYVFGIPAMNTNQSEYTFAVANNPNPDGTVTFSAGDNTVGNTKGRDNFYSEMQIPAYAHSYLLTSVLSTDYVDVKGDGVTDDDFGTYTKFNYSLKTANYGWKAPYGDNIAQYDEGFKSDKRDQKASYVSGTREQWYMHSVESKNQIAEFYTSARLDGKGINKTTDLSYKLDSITLYNKHERVLKKTSAVPIKTVIFNYDYSLCPGIPNTTGTGVGNNGKLTLRKIYIKHGHSMKSMISPYKFDYQSNPAYSAANKERWGSYQPSSPGKPNYIFPFVNQLDASSDVYAAAWQLSGITLPSGGNINVSYESDDYAYVQDKEAMEMFDVAGVGNSKNFYANSQLYVNKDNPNLYFYFRRDKSRELSSRSLKDNYIGNEELLQYNFEVAIKDKKYDYIKGYAEIDEIGECPNNTDYAYVKVKSVKPKEGAAAKLNPVTYTAINFSRYHVPQTFYPGQDDDLSGVANILAGIKAAFEELISIATNPVVMSVKENKCREVQLSGSIMRLKSPGLRKKGGGSRVKQMVFTDDWQKLAGSNNLVATYGKVYDYTIDGLNDDVKISSGVASYEPMIGGDENPLRQPVNYSVQKGSKFPPNDPVGLFQEVPLGETLYPGAVVGYSNVTVKSIHQKIARSGQGVDIYQFYTAKDFPIKAKYTPINIMEDSQDSKFSGNTTRFSSSQGFALEMNDMHGKPKRIENGTLLPPSTSYKLINSQDFYYFQEGNALTNIIPIIEHDPVTGKMAKTMAEVGVEMDFTVDTREKYDESRTNTYYASLNVAFITPIPVPIPIPMFYYYDYEYKNYYNSVVATKVIQRYGIMKEVKSYNEGAITLVKNEAFDPITGQALITSVNNEYNDTEYNVTYPAHWAYRAMGPSYQNILFRDSRASLSVSNNTVTIENISLQNYKVGDELYMEYKQGGAAKTNNMWVMDIQPMGTASLPNPHQQCGCVNNDPPIVDTVFLNVNTIIVKDGCTGIDYAGQIACDLFKATLKPRYKSSIFASGTITEVKITNVRSGAKNQLQDAVQQYTAMSMPFNADNSIKDEMSGLVNVSAREYSNEMTAKIYPFHLTSGTGWDLINDFLNGNRQIMRPYKEYVYLDDRKYASSFFRKTGLFDAKLFWKVNGATDQCVMEMRYCKQNTRVFKFYASTPPVYIAGYKYLEPVGISDLKWKLVNTTTKYSPWGQAIENKDAAGNFTAAQFGFNQQLPEAVATNAKSYDFFAESFEGLHLVQPLDALVKLPTSPFYALFGQTAMGTGIPYSTYNVGAGTGGAKIDTLNAHSGKSSLLTGASGHTIGFALKTSIPVSGQPVYDSFTMMHKGKYLISYWMKPKAPALNALRYEMPTVGGVFKSNIIDGWQQVEMIVTAPATGTQYNFALPKDIYIDDIRVMPYSANMKSFVYHPFNQRLMATLDENNFATFFEYDHEGNLVRTKKETEKGVVTVSESRSANPKN